jgi:hypothetical protein
MSRAHGAAIYKAHVTMQLADDDASAAWELLVSFREML